MKKIISKVVVTAVLAASVFAQNDLQPLAIVKLNKPETITVSMLKSYSSYYQKQLRLETLSLDQKKQLLDKYIREKLVLQAAAKEGISVTDTQVNEAFINTFRQQIGQNVTEAQLSDVIKKQTGKTLDDYIKAVTGMSTVDFKKQLKNQIIIQQYVYAKNQDKIKNAEVSNEDISKAYEMNKTKFAMNDTMKLFLVMVPKGSDESASKKLAEDLRSKYVADKKNLTAIANTPENGKTYRAGEMMLEKSADQAKVLGWSADKINELFGKAEGFTSELNTTESDYQFYSVEKKFPSKILGLNDVPNAGDIFVSPKTDKEAKSFAETFIAEGKNKLVEETKAKMSLEDLFSQIQAGNLKELDIIVKADVQGSVEAVKQSLVKLSNEEVVVKVIHSGVGAINESDVILASASNAIIIGFNVRPDNQARDVAERENVDLRLYRVIYQAIEDVEAAMKGMLDPKFEEKIIGQVEIRQTYKASGVGTIAGSYVLDGMITRNSSVRVTRGEDLIYDGPIASLKRFKDDAKEVKAGYECGIVLEKFNDLREGDMMEVYTMVEIPR